MSFPKVIYAGDKQLSLSVVMDVAVLKHASLKIVEVDLAVRVSVVHKHVLACFDPEPITRPFEWASARGERR